MTKTVLIITDKENFMIKALASNLEKSEFEVLHSSGSEENFETILKQASFLFLYPDQLSAFSVGYEKQILDSMQNAGEQKLFLAANTKEELDLLKADFPAGYLGGEYLKPLAIRQVVADMEALTTTDPVQAAPARHSVLVVDDDSTYLRMLAGCLAPRYDVTPVTSGMQAITYMARQQPDLVLMDYEMPITTGAQVFEMMKSEPGTADIPVIFLTGKNDKNSILDVMQQGPAGYLLKSMSMDHIMDKIEEYFREVDRINA